MEGQLLKQFGDILDWCYKDHSSILMLKKHGSAITLIEVDALMQTIRNQVDTPMFEGVGSEEARYTLLHSISGRIVIIYPNNIIIVLNDESFEVL